MMSLGSSFSFQIEQPKDNNFNNVDIERKIRKRKRRRNKTYRQRNKRKITCKEKAYVHTKRERTYAQREPCLQQTSSQSNHAYPPPTRKTFQNCSITMQMQRNIGNQRRLIDTKNA
jgi:hypothetical protein